MNTATRVYGRQYAVRSTALIRFSWKQMGMGLFVLVLLVSAFGVIYAKDVNRRLFIQYQTLQKQQQHYQVEWRKLLLEEGAWSTQSRVQWLAKKQLNMAVPSSQHIIFVKDTQH